MTERDRFLSADKRNVDYERWLLLREYHPLTELLFLNGQTLNAQRGSPEIGFASMTEQTATVRSNAVLKNNKPKRYVSFLS